MPIFRITPEVYAEVEAHSKLYHPDIAVPNYKMLNNGKMRCRDCENWFTRNKCEEQLGKTMSSLDIRRSN